MSMPSVSGNPGMVQPPAESGGAVLLPAVVDVLPIVAEGLPGMAAVSFGSLLEGVINNNNKHSQSIDLKYEYISSSPSVASLSSMSFEALEYAAADGAAGPGLAAEPEPEREDSEATPEQRTPGIDISASALLQLLPAGGSLPDAGRNLPPAGSVVIGSAGGAGGDALLPETVAAPAHPRAEVRVATVRHAATGAGLVPPQAPVFTSGPVIDHGNDVSTRESRMQPSSSPAPISAPAIDSGPELSPVLRDGAAGEVDAAVAPPAPPKQVANTARVEPALRDDPSATSFRVVAADPEQGGGQAATPVVRGMPASSGLSVPAVGATSTARAIFTTAPVTESGRESVLAAKPVEQLTAAGIAFSEARPMPSGTPGAFKGMTVADDPSQPGTMQQDPEVRLSPLRGMQHSPGPQLQPEPALAVATQGIAELSESTQHANAVHMQADSGSAPAASALAVAAPGIAELPEPTQHANAVDMQADSGSAPAATALAATHSRQLLSSGDVPATAPGMLPAMEAGRWAEALEARIRWFAARGGGIAEIRLDPPELGALHVKVHAGHEGASVHFTASSIAARELLEHSLPRLRELLAAGGMELVNVDVAQHQDAQHDTPHAFAEGSLRRGAERMVQAPDIVSEAPGRGTARLIDAYV